MSCRTRWIGALAGVLVGGPALAGDILVAPSGDTSGATDANNIEAAWYAAGPNDLVVLSDGDPSTADHYYVNRVMVAASYRIDTHRTGIDHASLVGESEKTTILEAVHNDDPRAWIFDSQYTGGKALTDAYWGTPLFGDYLKDWTMRDLTLRISNPVDPLTTGNSREFQAMAFWGGNGNYEFRNVTIEIGEGTSAEVFGPHIMWGSVGGAYDGHGNVVMKDCTIKDAWWGPIIMQSVGGEVTVTDLTTINVGVPVWFQAMWNDKTTLSDSTFEYTGKAGTRGIPVRWWDGPGILVLASSNVDIEDNDIDAPADDSSNWVNSLGVWPGIQISPTTINADGDYVADHYITIQGNVLKGVSDTPYGAVYVWPYRTDIEHHSHITVRDNTYVRDDAFVRAILLGADDSKINEQTLTPDDVHVLGTDDIVKLGN